MPAEAASEGLSQDGGAAGPLAQAIDEGFLRVVLAALAAMALRSRRRQADLDAALWRSGIAGHGAALRQAVHVLQARGLVDGVIVLADGGVLLSVTSRGFAALAPEVAER